MKPRKMWTSAHHGIIIGEPTHEIWFQSNEMALIPSPILVPKSWFTTLLSGSAWVSWLDTGGKKNRCAYSVLSDRPRRMSISPRKGTLWNCDQ